MTHWWVPVFSGIISSEENNFAIMKKTSLGAYVMVIVTAVAVILSVSLWYATPWRSWSGKDRAKKVRVQQPASGQQVPAVVPPAAK